MTKTTKTKSTANASERDRELDIAEAVRVVSRSRNEGVVLLFFNGNGLITLVGNVDAVREALREHVANGAPRYLDFLIFQACMALQCLLMAGSRPSAKMMLATYLSNGEMDDETLAVAERRVALAEEHLATEALKERGRRLSSSSNHILVDVAAEIISHRVAYGSESETRVPFLRLSFEYSEGLGKTVVPTALMLFGAGKSTNRIELECDESDISVLIQRLQAAKELLGKAVETNLNLS
ncbi:MAG: hypothetical protein JSR82_13040 [Verrucomicrobia bacterium]|nr:hypothetical protein [Verrucomicrobiota bacterium]